MPANPPLNIRVVWREWRTLLSLGGPILIAQLAQMANGFVDTVMAGHASAHDLAAVGISVSFWVPLSLFFVGVLGALQPIIAQHCGAKTEQHIAPMAWQGIYIALVASVLMVVLLLFTAPLVALFKPEAATAAIVDGYLKAFVWGVPALMILTALRGLTDGMGHTWVFMAFSLFGTLCNIPLNYIFIYGKLGMPALGGAGCGLATAIANTASLLALLAYLYKGKALAQLHLFSQRHAPSWAKIQPILTLGLPIGITIFVEVSMFCAIALFLTPMGAQTVAAHQIVLNATSICFMVPLSLGMAVLLRVSFLVGEKAYSQARLVARSSLILALMIASINAPVLFFARHALARLYTSDAAVLALAGKLFMLAAIFQVMDVIQVTAVNALRGYKDTAWPMGIILLAFWGMCLPLGYVLSYTSWLTPTMGAAGYWTALTIALALAAVLLTWRLMVFKPRVA